MYGCEEWDVYVLAADHAQRAVCMQCPCADCVLAVCWLCADCVQAAAIQAMGNSLRSSWSNRLQNTTTLYVRIINHNGATSDLGAGGKTCLNTAKEVQSPLICTPLGYVRLLSKKMC